MNVQLEWSNEQEEIQLPDALLDQFQQLLEITAEVEQLDTGMVDLTFVNDETIHQLNKQYRGIDRATDVLSFAMTETMEEEPEIVFEEETPSEMLGDIIISVPRAKQQSEEYGHSLERELGFLFVHGLLHLLGYDHGSDEEEREMFSKQEYILQKAGLLR